jgi:chlorobactene glucosyltransferase
MTALTAVFCVKLRKIQQENLPTGNLPFVSVIIPARNEEAKLGRCLASLIEQNYINYEIVVVDDCSTDRTAQIIEEFAQKSARITAVKALEKSPGWLGKCSALVQGYAHASGEYLLFTDADTWHRPNSIRDSVRYALALKADLVSFMPVQELGSFWERVIMPVLLGSFLCGDPFNKINDQKNPRAYAFGQYMMIKRSAYDAVGGHSSVHNQILDDITLSRNIKKNGFRVFAADGTPLYTVRMYNDLQSVWAGWVKNVYTFMDCNPFALAAALLLINCGMICPLLHASWLAAAWLSAAGTAATGLATATSIVDSSILAQSRSIWLTGMVLSEIILMFVWFQLSTQYYRGIRWYHVFLLPLGSLMVTALYLDSARRIYTGVKTSWKNREYSVKTDMSIGTALGALPVVATQLAED